MTSRSDPAAVEAVHDEQPAYIETLANELIDMLNKAEIAIANKISDARLEQDEYLAVWGLLPSKVRTAIKRAGN